MIKGLGLCSEQSVSATNLTHKKTERNLRSFNSPVFKIYIRINLHIKRQNVKHLHFIEITSQCNLGSSRGNGPKTVITCSKLSLPRFKDKCHSLINLTLLSTNSSCLSHAGLAHY